MQQPELQKRKYKCTNKWYTPYRDTNFGTLPYTRCTTQQETAEITHTYTNTRTHITVAEDQGAFQNEFRQQGQLSKSNATQSFISTMSMMYLPRKEGVQLSLSSHAMYASQGS